MTDHADLMKRLEYLASVYIGQQYHLNASIVTKPVITLRPGSPSVETKRIQRPMAPDGYLDTQHSLGLDPARVQSAWASVGQRSFGDCILIEAVATGKGFLGKPLFKVTGVRQPRYEAILTTAFLIHASDGSAIVGDSERSVIGRRKAYDELIHEDWSKTVLWEDGGNILEKYTVSNARLIRSPKSALVVELQGLGPKFVSERKGGRDRTFAVYRPLTVRVVKADDGTWCEMFCYPSLTFFLYAKDTERKREIERAEAANVALDITDEDADALSSLAF